MNRRLALAALLAAALPGCAGPSGIEAGPLQLSEAPPDAPMRAGYLTLINHGPGPRTLVGARSAAFGSVEIHRTETVDGVARMREEREIVIAPGATLVFEPFGRHLMLMQPHPSAPGAVAVELCFADGQCVTARER